VLKGCLTAFWSKYEVKVALHHARNIVKHAEKIGCRVEEKQLAEKEATNVFDDATASGSASSSGSPSKAGSASSKAMKKKKAKKPRK